MTGRARDELLQRLRAPDVANRTYGIVTFSKAQQTLIEDLLEKEQRKRPELASHFDESNPEPTCAGPTPSASST